MTMSMKRDIDKMFRNLEKDMKSEVSKQAMNDKHEIVCPECDKKRKISFKNGKGKCPKCGSTITLDLNWE